MTGLGEGTFEPKVALKADGALVNARYERMAIMLADGVGELEAMKVTGGGSTKEARRYGRRIFANGTFKGRVATLMAEKEELERDPIWGEAMWQVNQLYRICVATEDVKNMMEAVKMRLTIADKMQARKAAEEPPPPPDATARGPGAPSAKNPQTAQFDPATIRSKLMRYGREDEPDVDAEADEADADGGPVH